MKTATKQSLFHSSEEEVHCVSGAGVVHGVPLNLGRCIAAGRIPTDPLVRAATSFYYDPKWVPDEDHLGTPEDRLAWEEFIDWAVSEFLTRPKLSPAEVRKMHEGDRIQLFRRATHQDLKDELEIANAPFRVRAIRGLLPDGSEGTSNGSQPNGGDPV